MAKAYLLLHRSQFTLSMTAEAYWIIAGQLLTIVYYMAVYQGIHIEWIEMKENGGYDVHEIASISLCK